MTAVNPKILLVAMVAGMLALALSLGLCVQDDTYISLRYARNLVDGHGLVYNIGEPPVEGYTNFLWTVLLAGVLALGANGVLASVWLGMLAAVGLVFFTAWWGRDSPGLAGRPLLALVAPALVALDPGLLLEGVQGLETVFFSLLVTAMVWAVVREIEDPDAVPWSALIGALAALTRPEGVLFYGLLHGVRLVALRRPPGRAALTGWAVFVLFLGSHLLFRWRFYGELLPNTFYAKTGGGSAAWARGAEYLVTFAGRHVGLVGLGVVGAAVAARRRSPRDLASLVVVGVYLLYVVGVGGDFKHSGRFVLPVLALLALWAQDGLAWLARQAEVRAVSGAVVIACALGLCAVDAVRYWPTSRGAAAYRVLNQADRVEVGQFLRANLAPDAWLAIHSAGTVPYLSGLRTVDCLGLSDHHIARVEVPGMGTGMPGHEKTDYAYVFGRHPTVYLPELDMVTAEPRQLLVPTDFPPDFDTHYTQRSMSLPSGKTLNFWFHESHSAW